MWVIIFAFLSFSLVVNAQDDLESAPIEGKAKEALIDSITDGYFDWASISMSGKVSGNMFPFSPTVKIYMEKDELLIISCSVFLMGEVGRIEIDRNQTLVINKMSGKYTTVETALMESMCPGGLSAIQNLLLGRVAILGEGELNAENAADVDIYEVEPSLLMLVPDQDFEATGYIYFYFIDRISKFTDRFVVMNVDLTDVLADLNYSYTAKEITLNGATELNGRQVEMTLKLNQPDVKTKAINRQDISKLKKVGVRDILR